VSVGGRAFADGRVSGRGRIGGAEEMDVLCADLSADEDRMLAFVSVLGSGVGEISSGDPLEGDMILLVVNVLKRSWIVQ
jgi:hypothetical protein